MKKCTIGLFSKIVTFLVFAVLFVPLTGIAFYFVFIYPQTHHEEQEEDYMSLDLVAEIASQRFRLQNS